LEKILIGIVSGVISGIGMGGGTILIFLLTNISNMEQHIAQATNLIFFIPTSIVAIIINIKNKKVNLKLALIISIAGVIGAIIGAKISVNLDVQTLRKFWGYFLAIIAVHEIYTLIKLYINNKKRHNKIKQT
jgi:hypothetical protein